VFAKCDKDQSGYLDLQEFTSAVRQTLNVPENSICDYELRTVYNEMDADNNGRVYIEELMNFLTQGFRTPEEIANRAQVRINRVRKNLKTAFQSRCTSNEMSVRKLFSKLDFDGDNTLSMYEFKAFVRNELKLNFWDICNTDIEDFFKYLDRDKGGTIDVEELMAFVKLNHSDRPKQYSFVKDPSSSGDFTSMRKKTKKTYKQLLLEDSFRSASLPNLSRLPYTSSVVSLGRDYAPTNRNCLQLSAKMFFTPEKCGA
jgi:Ca2+-binding EF-hand superfamily protein